MSTASTINTITTQTLSYAPAVIAGVQAAELSGASGETKAQAVVNAVLAGSGAAESATNPNVAGIASLVNLFVSIFNATGLFSHKATVPAVAPAKTVV